MRKAGLAVVFACFISSGAARAEPPTDVNRLARETRQYVADERRLGSSCADLAELERAAASTLPNVAIMYRNAAMLRRQEQLAAVARPIQEFAARAPMWTPEYVATATAAVLNAATAQLIPSIRAARAAIEQLECLDPAAYQRQRALFLANTKRIEGVLKTEDECRKSKPCLAARALSYTCQSVAERRAAVEAIAKERANPGGVVDLVRLHDLGLMVQDLDVRIAATSADYATLAGQPFNESSCSAR